MESPPPNTETRPSDASLPSRIGGYRVVRRLATGGTSDVLLARAEGPHGFERPVVLKLLLQQFREDEKFERMFAREAAAYARLSHPAIVKLFDFFSDASQLVMVLEFIDGLPLHKLRALLRPKGRTLDDRAAMFIGWRVFSALTAAHSARDPQTGEYSPVIHRDVNPSNVLIPWDGHVKIADFGIAKVAGIDGETQAGLIKGTYGYMAPEQVRGEPLTVRADVYAASLLLWELLAGRKAIVRGTSADIDVLRAMAEPKFPALASVRPDLPKAVLDAVARGLEPDPDWRSVYADELCSALRTAISLDEGRQALVEVLAHARPPSMTEDLAATTSRPAPMRPIAPSPSDSQETLRFRSDLPPDASPDDTLADPPKIPPAPLLPRQTLGTTIPVTGTGRPPANPATQPFSAVTTLRMNSGGSPSPSARPGSPSRLAPKTPQGLSPPKTPSAPPPPAAGPVSSPPSPLARPTPAAVSPPSAPPPAPPATPPLAWHPANPAGVPPTVSMVPRPQRVVVPAPAHQAQPGAPPASPLAATVAAHGPSTNPLASTPAAPAWAPPPIRPPSPPAGWTPAHPSSTGGSSVMPAGVPMWQGHRGWVVAITLSVVVSLFSLLVIILWTRKDTSASTPPKPSASARAQGPETAASVGSAAPAPPAPPPVASAAAPAPAAPAENPAPPESPAVAATSLPMAASPTSTMGTLRVSTPGGHRVWIDEHLAGESPGSFPVHCGAHSVRIGSHGSVQHVNVPCGGDVEAR